ncbi:YagK/YfjJ domain-containing protein [Burkholderia gladioli]|uniref:YagK/YfjJ domain-containing protein n=1 Tax=Burkholderia gladioli TaxID=28095 RepID=UPI00163F5A4B|nr:inovirus-type Gp2 protein [Burkholderia gladioli]
MSFARREQVFANTLTFENLGYGAWDVIGVGDRVWARGEYSAVFTKLITLLKFVLDTKDIAYDVKLKGNRKYVAKLSTGLASCFQRLNWLPDICLQGWACSPDVGLFVDCYASHPDIRRCACVDPAELVRDDLIEAEVFNDFVAYMRTEAKRRGVKKAMHNWVYGATAVEKRSIQRYLRTMPNASTKLLTVRCELQYREDAMSEADVMIRSSLASVPGPFHDRRRDRGAPECASRFDPERAMADRDSFVANPLGKDKELFEHRLGYVWKIEQDKNGMIHHHVLFIFDGQCVKDEFAALDRIGVRWDAITKGAGYLHSSHYEKKSFIEKGRWHYGFIDGHKPEMLELMIEDASSYFTKDEQLLRFKPTPGSRTLTKGRRHKKREGGPGRPRKQVRVV